MGCSKVLAAILLAGLISGCADPGADQTESETPPTIKDETAEGVARAASEISDDGLAGRWELRVFASSYPRWLLDVDDDGTATLIESSSKSPNYESISFAKTSDGITVTMVEIQACGNRSFQFILDGSGSSYSGYVYGERRGCKGNRFKSPPDFVVCLRRAWSMRIRRIASAAAAKK